MGPLLYCLLAAALPPPTGELLQPADPIHLTVELRASDVAGMRALVAAQQTPGSPYFRRYLTPLQFGERFGASPPRYARLAAWLSSAGLLIETYPNRLVVGATGNASQVEALLGVRLRHVAGQPPALHAPDRAPRLPADLEGQVLILAGLDSRVQHRHRLRDSYQDLTFGPQDLRRMYDLNPLLDGGFAGAGAELVVLGAAEPPQWLVDPLDVSFFYLNASDSLATFVLRTLPNPANDVETSSGGNGEQELDVEMQSVGAPEASTITLVQPPYSEQFIAGPNDIVNNLPNATAVSVSYGICEIQEIQSSPTEPAAMQQLILQGLLEGQTWSAASGDNGSDDCADQSAPAVDFPASMPEFVGVGGTQPQGVSWDANGAIPQYEPEQVWNDGLGGAAGGGFSILFPAPAYQRSALPQGFFPAGPLTDGGRELPDGGRAVPDVALLAAPSPGVAVDDTFEKVLDPIGGTSVASPLAAGFFALIADRVGCRLGDVHAALYALGLAQYDGGAQVYHDITVSSVQSDGLPGADAGVGFDPASGWGSLDVAALAAAFPPCPPLDAGLTFDGGPIDAGPTPALTQDPVAYQPCADLACLSPEVCQVLPEGPARCVITCGPDGGCAAGTACDRTGACIPGNADAGLGAPCAAPLDCAPAFTCIQQFDSKGNPTGAYCTDACGAGFQACPAGAFCDVSAGSFCALGCDGGCQTGLVCQPQPPLGGGCLSPCLAQADCDSLAPGSTCEAASGLCVFPPDAGVDGGGDAGSDGGLADAGFTLDGGADGGFPDGGALDAGAKDAGAADAGESDAGVADAGVADAGVADAGQLDGGARDAGALDAGHGAGVDAGQPPPDAGAGAPDAGTMAGGGGCGCAAGSGGGGELLLAVGFLVAGLRKRRGPRHDAARRLLP